MSTLCLGITLLGQCALPVMAEGEAPSSESRGRSRGETDASKSTDVSSPKTLDGSIIYDVLSARAEESIKQGKLSEAEDLLEQALEEAKLNKNGPLQRRTLVELSKLSLECGKPDKFLEYEKELGSVPTTERLLEASKKYVERGELNGAVILLEFAQRQFKPESALQPEQKEVLESLADLYAKTGDRHKMVKTRNLISSEETTQVASTAIDTVAFFDDSFETTSNSFEEKLWHADYLASKQPAVDAVLAFLDILAIDKNGKTSASETERVRTIDRFCRLLLKYGRVKRADQVTRDELARLKVAESSEKRSMLHEAYLLTDVALIYIAQSKFTLAEALLDKAYKVFLDALGADHPKTILTVADIASMKQHMLSLPDAESKYKEAFERALKQPKYGRLALESLATDYITVLKKQGKDHECDEVEKRIGLQGSQPIHPFPHLENK